jgi:hypothetical protein
LAVKIDNLIKRTCKAAGISYSSVYRVVNGKSSPESNRPKERKKTLDDFNRCVIKWTLIVSSISFLIFETVGAFFLLYML